MSKQCLTLTIDLVSHISINSLYEYKLEDLDDSDYTISRNVRKRYNETADKFRKETVKYVKKNMKEQGYEMSKDLNKKYDVELFFTFNRRKTDSHNYLKILLDILEDANVYPNDDLAMPQVIDVVQNDNNLNQVWIRVTKRNNIGAFENEDAVNNFIKNFNIGNSKEKNRLLDMFKNNRLDFNIVKVVKRKIVKK